MKILHLPLKKEWYHKIESGEKTEEYREIKPYWWHRIQKDYTCVKFSYGYTRRTMTFEIVSVMIGYGRPEWGAPNKEVFIIKLGNRIV